MKSLISLPNVKNTELFKVSHFPYCSPGLSVGKQKFVVSILLRLLCEVMLKYFLFCF